MRRTEELPFLSQPNTILKKKGMHRKFERIDSITEKNIIPQELKAEQSSIEISVDKIPQLRPSKKWLAKLKQGRQFL